MRVDLPAPFSPTSARTSPAATDIETPLSASTPGQDFEQRRISRRSPGAARPRGRLGVGLVGRVLWHR